jgi:outer membrane protein TolC
VCAQISLSTVVDLAEKNSSKVKLAQADVQKAHAALAESEDAVIPSVQFGTGLPVFPEVGFTGTPPSLWAASVQSLIFGVPQKRYIDAARFGQVAATANLKDAREQVDLDASTAYIELDTYSRELDAARQQEGFASRLVEIEQERADAGVDPLSELLQAKLSAAQLKLKRLHLETSAATAVAKLCAMTGLPAGSLVPDHNSIPEIPRIRADAPVRTPSSIEAAQAEARSKEFQAKGDEEINYLPQLSFVAQYNRNTTLLNNVNYYFAHSLPSDNFSSGISIQVPLFDMAHRAKSRGSVAEALRSRVEAEQAAQQNDIQIASLTGNIRELDAQAEIASLKQQIADEQLKAVLAQLELGNGAGNQPGAPAQLTPKAEQLARIDEQQKRQDAMDAQLDLSKARLGLLRALGHMEDWLAELHGKSQ